jgi:hypothetical protein
MNPKFDDAWLSWAIGIEDEAGCDISAGLDWGQDLGEYLANAQGCINREKLISVLQEDVGALLSEKEIEDIVNVAQTHVRDRIKEKLQSFAAA